MTFPIHSVQSAPDESQPLLEKIVDAYGFLPNLAGGIAESPALLKGFLGLAGSFDAPEMTLDPIARQVVLLTTSQVNGCNYCMAAHSMLAAKSGLETAEIDRLVAGDSLTDGRLESLRKFTRSMVEQRGHVSNDELAALLQAGFDRAHILEIILGVTLKTLTNYTNHLIKAEINEQFAAFAPKRAA